MAGVAGLLSAATPVAGPAGNTTVAGWLQSLKSNNESIRTSAAYGLDISDECTPDEIALLLGALKDPNAFTRRYVAAALGEVIPPTEQITKALIDALSDPDVAVREQSAVALSKIGAPAIPALLKELATLSRQEYAKPGGGKATGIVFALSKNGEDVIEPFECPR